SRFRLFGGCWYLEVVPTYRFTVDGKKKDRFHAERLSYIKRIERNRAVLSQILLWNEALCSVRPDSKQFLTFDRALTFDAEPRTAGEELVAWEDDASENQTEAQPEWEALQPIGAEP